MMYECRYCRKQYRTKNSCAVCEKYHKIPDEIVETTYQRNDSHGYPSLIKVVFDDGVKCTYKLVL